MKEFIQKHTTLILLVLVMIAGSLWHMSVVHSLKNDVDRWKTNFQTAQEDINGVVSSYKTKEDSLIVYYSEQIKLKQAELNEMSKDLVSNKELVKKYKKLSEVTQIETEFIHDTIRIPVPMEIYDTIINYKDSCFKAQFEFNYGLFGINGMNISNKQEIVSGARKNGLFKTSQSIDIVNSNKCINTTGIQSYTIVVENKWYNNPIITIPASLLTGYVIGKATQ